MSLSCAARVPLSCFRLRLKSRIAAELACCVARTVLPSSIRLHGLRQRLGRGLGQGGARVEQSLQVGAAVGERGAELVDDGHQLLPVDRVDRGVDVLEHGRDRHRDLGVGARDPAAGPQVGGVAAPRLQVDVLLAHNGPVGDDRDRAGRHVGAVVEAQVDQDAAGGQPQVVDPADLDAAVGHLGPTEDAAAVREVGGHDVAAAEQQLAQADVARGQEGHGEQRDRREGDQLDLDRATDHRLNPPSSRDNSWACPADGVAEPSRGGAVAGRDFWSDFSSDSIPGIPGRARRATTRADTGTAAGTTRYEREAQPGQAGQRRLRGERGQGGQTGETLGPEPGSVLLQQLRDVEVDGGVQVGVVALDRALGGVVGEGKGQQQPQRVRQVVAGPGQLGQGRLEGFQVGHRVVLARR